MSIVRASAGGSFRWTLSPVCWSESGAGPRCLPCESRVLVAASRARGARAVARAVFASWTRVRGVWIETLLRAPPPDMGPLDDIVACVVVRIGASLAQVRLLIPIRARCGRKPLPAAREPPPRLLAPATSPPTAGYHPRTAPELLLKSPGPVPSTQTHAGLPVPPRAPPHGRLPACSRSSAHRGVPRLPQARPRRVRPQ